MKTRKNKVIGTDINNNILEIDVENLTFRPAVYGILIEDDNVLLSKQWDGYNFPGGGINIDETINEALEREFWEETGIKIKRSSLVSCESCFYHSTKHKEDWNSIRIYYLCERIGGDFSIANAGEDERDYIGMPEWISLDDIGKIKFYSSIDNIVVINKVLEIIKKQL